MIGESLAGASQMSLIMDETAAAVQNASLMLKWRYRLPLSSLAGASRMPLMAEGCRLLHRCKLGVLEAGGCFMGTEVLLPLQCY